MLEHAERELSRDRSQHLASELRDILPEPHGEPVEVGREALLAELPDRVVERTLADAVAQVTARLDRLQQSEPPAVDDGLGLDLW